MRSIFNKNLAAIILSLILPGMNLNAQVNLQWAKAFGGTGSETGYSISTDSNGNVYTTGHFAGTGDFDPGPSIHNLTAVGEWDIFITKLDASGNFLWAVNFGGGDIDQGFAIATDKDGYVYVTGTFRDTVDFDPGLGIHQIIATGYYDIFICKFDSNGGFVWAKNFGGSDQDEGHSVAVDDRGNVYTAGFFEDVVDFDPGSGNYELTAFGNRDVFISKLDVNGNLIWAKQQGGVSLDEGSTVAISSNGDILVSSYFRQTADFDPDTASYLLTSAGDRDVGITKLDSNGNFIWAKGISGAGDILTTSLKVDTEDRIYITGFFYNTADFDPDTGIYNLSSINGIDAYIAKYTPNGDLIWAKAIGGISTESSQDLAIDAEGNIYAIGYFQQTPDFDPDSGVYNLTSSGNFDLFIVKLDSSGKLAWARNLGGTSDDRAQALSVDMHNNIYLSGWFSGPADFDPDSSVYLLNSTGAIDIFVTKLSQNSPVGITPNNFNLNCIVFPNPTTGNLTIKLVDNLYDYSVTVTDIRGMIIQKQQGTTSVHNLDLNNLSNGLYFLKVSSKDGSKTMKVIKR